MIKRGEFFGSLVVLFILFVVINHLTSTDIYETMRTLKRPVVLHDTTSVMRYVDRYIHDTTVITQTKTEYIEKVSLIGKMQDYADEKETTIKLETDDHFFEFDAKYVKFQCNGKLVELDDETVCAGDWVITAKEIIE
jgi:uncharacterized membrane protein YheB (UPF0754 family)